MWVAHIITVFKMPMYVTVGNEDCICAAYILYGHKYMYLAVMMQ